jgi:hypothetical protein
MTRQTLGMDRVGATHASPLRRAAAITLAVLGAWGGGNHEARAASESLTPEPGARASHPAKRFALELDGQMVGFLDAVSGGGVKAEVIDERTEPGGLLRKRLGPPRAQEIALQIGLAMDPAFYRWIAQTWEAGATGRAGDGETGREDTAERASGPAGRFAPSPRLPVSPSPSVARNGAVLELDDSGAVRARREFVNARLTELTVPALDVAEKKPGSLTVKILPESVRFVKGEGAPPESGPSASPPPHFVGYPRPRRPDACVWLPCNFRVLLDGLEETRITRVEAFTVKTVANRNAPKGTPGGAPSTYTTLTPSLSLTITEATADPWFDWLESFTLQGSREPEQEKNGVILLLSPSRAELARIDLRGVGLCGLTPASTETNEGAGAPPVGADRSARPHVSADLYVQRIGFSAADRPQAEAATSAPRQPLRFQSILK